MAALHTIVSPVKSYKLVFAEEHTPLPFTAHIHAQSCLEHSELQKLLRRLPY